MKYAKIKQGTEAWELMNNVFTFHKKWGDHKEEISNFLGFPMNNNIAFEISNLWVRPETIEKLRPEWIRDFKKNESPTPAKTKSKVKKAWLELCEKLGLETYKFSDFTWKYGIIMEGNTQAFKFDEDYIFSIENDKYNFSRHDWAEIVEEATFLRMKADHLDKEALKQLVTTS